MVCSSCRCSRSTRAAAAARDSLPAPAIARCPVSRLVDNFGKDLGEIVEVTWRDTDDPSVKCYEVFVRETPVSTECTRCGVEKSEHAGSDHVFKNINCQLEYEAGSHPFVPDGKTDTCARCTYPKEDHAPEGPYYDPVCGKSISPYTSNNICILSPHQTGNHRDAKGREFNVTYIQKMPLKPHCRHHLEFRSDCAECERENL